MSTLDSGRLYARWVVTVACFVLFACQASVDAQQTFRTASGEVLVETKAAGLEQPWSLAFLPGGRVLVSERPGRLRIVSSEGVLSPAVEGVPAVHAIPDRSPGLLDVALDRGYAHNQTIYFCYVEPVDGGGRTAVATAKLLDGQHPRLDGLRTIFRAKGPAGVESSFGCRLLQALDGNLLVAIGECDHWHEAQNLRSHLGTIVRIDPDGFAPPDNPFRNRPDALPEIWSYGHRNPQGLAIRPGTGKLWSHEHGRRGGDEINIIEPGKNYGWPVIGYGTGYDGSKIHTGTHRDGMEQPVRHWEPSIAPSGMAFYTGTMFPLWRNSLFIGALAGRVLVRLELDDEGGVVAEERLLAGLNERIRDVRQGPDGALWLLSASDAGRLLRVSPVSSFRAKAPLGENE